METKFINNNHLLIISDNAKGISKNVIDRIYDPYFSTKSTKGGTGLGLYMSKIIVEEHCDGELQVSSSSSGSVFTMIIPQSNKE